MLADVSEEGAASIFRVEEWNKVALLSLFEWFRTFYITIETVLSSGTSVSTRIYGVVSEKILIFVDMRRKNLEFVP
jgi:hypothetical protein